MAQLRVVGSPRRSRRMVRSKRTRGRPDLRRTVRDALRAEGEPIKRAFVETGGATPPARAVARRVGLDGVVCPRADPFRACRRRGTNEGRGFTLGTRLTRITRELSSRDPDDALDRTAAAVADWSGGTRLGDGLRDFNDQWGVRGMARGAVVVILSDGWDRGEPEVMAEQMAAPASGRLPGHLGQPAQGVAGLCAARAGHGRRHALHRRVRRGTFGRVTRTAGGADRGLNTAECERSERPYRADDREGDTQRPRAVAATGKTRCRRGVVDLEGSGPRQPGAAMAVSEDGEVAGSVSGGCVEGAVVTEALERAREERPAHRHLRLQRRRSVRRRPHVRRHDPSVHRAPRLVNVATPIFDQLELRSAPSARPRSQR